MPADDFLFFALQMVLYRRASRRQAALCRALPKRGQTAVYGMRRNFRVQLQQCQILPGVQGAHYPQAGRRAYAENAQQGYAVEAKKALCRAVSQMQKIQSKGLIPIPAKVAFYSVTNIGSYTHKKTGRGAIYWLPRPVLFVYSSFSCHSFNTASTCSISCSLFGI